MSMGWVTQLFQDANLGDICTFITFMLSVIGLPHIIKFGIQHSMESKSELEKYRTKALSSILDADNLFRKCNNTINKPERRDETIECLEKIETKISKIQHDLAYVETSSIETLATEMKMEWDRLFDNWGKCCYREKGIYTEKEDNNRDFRLFELRKVRAYYKGKESYGGHDFNSLDLESVKKYYRMTESKLKRIIEAAPRELHIPEKKKKELLRKYSVE